MLVETSLLSWNRPWA